MISEKQLREARILVVDDNPQNLDVLIKHLEGFNVMVALSGEDALKLSRETAPDIVLLDVMMPGIDGFETCARLKELKSLSDVPVIFLTALKDTIYKLKGFQVGGVDYITKPPQFEEVIARIKTHVTIKMQRELLEAQARDLEMLAKTDPLTMLPNRRGFLEAAHMEFARAVRESSRFSIVLADIDFFKKVNDTYGHECGDEVLQKTSSLMKNNLRASDTIGRWGGEEFIMLLPNTVKQNAVVAADNIRKQVETAPFDFQGDSFTVTITLGVGECNGGTTLQQCIKAADDSLYKGKATGRNCVVCL